MTARQLRIIELRGQLRGWLSAERRDELLDELGRLVKAEAIADNQPRAIAPERSTR